RLLRSLYFESTRLSRRDADSYRHLLEDHEEIYQAIKNRDSDHAASATERHLRRGISFVFETLAAETNKDAESTGEQAQPA
ncbi:MAG: FCD domain-containing protein, partial [Chloroflexota bacterium]|nr:FCD domain-containing protein [Chloroflexota bacterium]